MDYQVHLEDGKKARVSARCVRLDCGRIRLDISSQKSISGLRCTCLALLDGGSIFVSGCANTALIAFSSPNTDPRVMPKLSEPKPLIQTCENGDYAPFDSGIRELIDYSSGIKLDLGWLRATETISAGCSSEQSRETYTYMQVFFGASNVIFLNGLQTAPRLTPAQ